MTQEKLCEILHDTFGVKGGYDMIWAALAEKSTIYGSFWLSMNTNYLKMFYYELTKEEITV